MAITFVNIWETKILDTIRTFLNNEFAGTIPIYTGDFKDMGNQSIRLNPVGTDLIERMSTAEMREYILDVSYTFKEKTVKKNVQLEISSRRERCCGRALVGHQSR